MLLRMTVVRVFRLQNACEEYLSNSLKKGNLFETVIAKMCSVVLDHERIVNEKLREVTTGAQKSFLVEAFDKILVEEKVPYGFERNYPIYSKTRP